MKKQLLVFKYITDRSWGSHFAWGDWVILKQLNYDQTDIIVGPQSQVGLGIGATLLALGFVGQLAKNAVENVESDVE